MALVFLHIYPKSTQDFICNGSRMSLLFIIGDVVNHHDHDILLRYPMIPHHMESVADVSL